MGFVGGSQAAASAGRVASRRVAQLSSAQLMQRSERSSKHVEWEGRVLRAAQGAGAGDGAGVSPASAVEIVCARARAEVYEYEYVARVVVAAHVGARARRHALDVSARTVRTVQLSMYATPMPTPVSDAMRCAAMRCRASASFPI